MKEIAASGCRLVGDGGCLPIQENLGYTEIYRRKAVILIVYADMGKTRTQFDCFYAAANTEILLPPQRCLETFGTTVINYHLVAELDDDPGKVRIREGRLEASKPALIVPDMYSSLDMDGFGSAAREYLEFLKEHEDSIRILQYGYRLKQESYSEQVVTDSLANVIERVLADVKKANMPFDAVVKGVDEPWDVCLIKLLWVEVNSSAPVNIRELEEVRIKEMAERVAAADPSRGEIELAFSKAEKDRSLVNELGALLRRKGLFEEYQDRFFKLFRKN